MHILIINIIIVFLIGGLIFSLPGESRKRKKKWFLVVSFVQLWFIHSMVDIKSVPDLEPYKMYFEMSSSWNIKQVVNAVLHSEMEIGYILFFRIVYFLTSNFQVFLTIYSFVLLFLYYRLIEHESPFVFCSVLLLLVGPFNQSIFVIRQHLAVAVMLASYPLIRDRKLIKFVLVSFLAMLFHRSAIIFLPVYFLYGLQGKKTKWVLVGAGAVAVFFFIFIASYVGEFFAIYQSYIDDENGQNITGVFISLALVITPLVIMRDKVWKEGMNRFSFILLYLYLIVSIGGLGFNATGRLAVYFSAGTVFLIPLSMKYLSSISLRTVYFLVVFALFFLLVFRGSASTYIEHFSLVPLF